MDQQQQYFIDILARLIDAPTQFHTKNENFKKYLDEQLTQLPWSLETSIIEYLFEINTTWFKEEPKRKFTDTVFNNDDESHYYNESFELKAYSFSERASNLFDYSNNIKRLDRVSLSVEQWMDKNGLYEPADYHPDPHFAERAFIVNVLVPCYGEEILEYVEPQKEIENKTKGKKYKIDFFIKANTYQVAIDIDGSEYHDPKKVGEDKFEHDLERGNFIQFSCGKHYRIPARKILQSPEECIKEIKAILQGFKLEKQGTFLRESFQHPVFKKPLSGVDKILAKMGIFNTDTDTDTNGKEPSFSEEEINLLILILDYIKWFRPFQLSILLALINAEGKNEFIIKERVCPSGLIEAALFDLKNLITYAQIFYDIKFAFPQKIIIQKKDSNDNYHSNQILENYKAKIGPDKIGENYKGFLPFEIVNTFENDKKIDIIIDLSRDGRIPIIPDGTIKPDILGNESANLSTLRARLTALSIERMGLRNHLKPPNFEKRIVDYFTRRYLRIPALYHHIEKENPKEECRQYEIVKEVLKGNSVFGIMPTGRGKSVVFQLPSILLPGGAIVISPLRALMRDQIEDLVKNRGFNSVEAITSELDKAEKDIALDDFMKGYTNLLYVSPERLQIINFREKLAQAVTTVHISFFAIDEAHCVSEWGHDFRLSYLHIPEFIKKIEEMQGEKPPIVALTATATIPVRRDVCHILNLINKDVRNGGNVIAEANIDRPELSFSVHLVEGSSYPEDKQNILKEVLTKKIPVAMKSSYEDFNWDRFSQGDWERGTGVIFCIYASPVGQKTWQDGVGAVKEYLSKQAEVIPDENVYHYSSKEPKYCPKCGSLAIRSLTRHELDEDETSDAGAYTCVNGCNFEVPDSYKGKWNDYCIDVQRRFKHKEIPLLVSTKAYGMGIDNRGLKFIVHYGMSSSIEGYYQEVGRAGRDGDQSHCALIVRIPQDDCWNNNISKLNSLLIDKLPCKTNNFLKCAPPYNLPEPCDFARQFRMVLQYYIKPDTFAKECANFWEELFMSNRDSKDFIKKKVCGGGLQGDHRIQQRQSYLYRLKQLGLISNFMQEYQPHGNHFDVIFHVVKTRNILQSELKRNLTESLFEIYQASKEEDKKIENKKSDMEKARKIAENTISGYLTYDDQLSKILIEKTVFELFSAIRNYVLEMRIASFKKLMAYIYQKESCRRRDLLDGLDYIHGSEEDRCDFCDVCISSLEFKTTRAKVPEESVQFRDVISTVHDAFRHEDIDQIISNTNTAIQLKILDTVGMHAMTRLESDPYNISANLAAGIAFASDKNESRRMTASGYFQRYSEITNVDKKDFNLAQKGYNHHIKYNRAEAIKSYATEGSAFDNRDGIALLDEDTKEADIPAVDKINLKAIRYAEEFRITINNLFSDLNKELDNF